MTYREDIDGLRAVAVLLVIFHHLDISVFSGGYIGVDVFFVISGFLITSIIAPKIDSGHFSFSGFYIGRVKRLFPAAFLVIVATIIAFSFFMLPGDLERLYESAVWVVFYLGNFFFWIEHGGYFGGGAAQAPLLHMWSLAVEEQFYLVWPVALFFCFKFLPKKVILPFLFFTFVLTCVFSEWVTQRTFGAAYYLLPTRMFELLAGAVLGIYLSQRKIEGLTFYQNWASIVGLVLIVSSSFVLNEHSSFPGLNALIPVAGTVLLLMSQNGLFNRILSKAPFVFTGKLSYSMYLWHWPIIAALNYLEVNLSFSVSITVLACIYGLSYITWLFIEQPCRSIGWPQKKVITNFFIIPSCFVVIVGSVGAFANGFPSRFESPVIEMQKAFFSFPNEDRVGCHASLREADRYPSEDCISGKGDNSQDRVLLLGDSHANHFFPFLREIAGASGYSIQDYTMDQCAPFYKTAWGQNAFKANLCRERNNKAFEYLTNQKPKFVALAASWPGHGTGKLHVDGRRITSQEEKFTLLVTSMKNTLNMIFEAGSTPIIIMGVPDLGGNFKEICIRPRRFMFCDSAYK